MKSSLSRSYCKTKFSAYNTTVGNDRHLKRIKTQNLKQSRITDSICLEQLWKGHYKYQEHNWLRYKMKLILQRFSSKLLSQLFTLTLYFRSLCWDAWCARRIFCHILFMYFFILVYNNLVISSIFFTSPLKLL